MELTEIYENLKNIEAESKISLGAVEESKDIDHLGLVKGICDEVGLVELVDEEIDPGNQLLTTGDCVQAMVMNIMGLATRALYLTPQFFANKPVEYLIKKGITAEHLNQHSLGRALDRIDEADGTKLFSKIALSIAQLFNVNRKFMHLDTTTMNIHGEYMSQDQEEILINFGKSKLGPTLKQFVISLIVSGDGGIPQYAEILPGNTSDKTYFREVICKLIKDIKESKQDSYFVADSALYSEKNIQAIASVKFVTRVPENIKEAKLLIEEIGPNEMIEEDRGYFIKEFKSNYGAINQRWLLVYSNQGFKREARTLKINIERARKKFETQLSKLSSKGFKSKRDAQKALSKLAKESKYFSAKNITTSSVNKRGKKGRPKKDEQVEKEYQIACEIAYSKRKINKFLSHKGKFIIVTNELETKNLSSKEMLSYYKDQQKVERGFKFLKDSTFMSSTVFLKSEKRIRSLGIVMCIGLLIYATLERLFRSKLKEQAETIPDQKGKPTEKPTMKWVFQIFEGIHLLYRKTELGSEVKVLNLQTIHKKILSILGSLYAKPYFLRC